MSVEQTHVFNACEALSARGLESHSITLAAVRESLGTRGSFSTLAPHVRDWKNARHAARQSAPLPMPAEVGTHSAWMMENLWNSALAAARVEAMRACRAELTAEKAAHAEALAEIARLEAEAACLLEEHTLAFAAAELRAEVSQDLRAQLSAANERAAHAQERLIEEFAAREALTVQLAAAREEAAKLRGALEALSQR